MYKLLLCWRYLLTRYLALACIVSVMLGRGHAHRRQQRHERLQHQAARPAARAALRRRHRGQRLRRLRRPGRQDGPHPRRSRLNEQHRGHDADRWKSSPCSSSRYNGTADHPAGPAHRHRSRRPGAASAASREYLLDPAGPGPAVVRAEPEAPRALLQQHRQPAPAASAVAATRAGRSAGEKPPPEPPPSRPPMPPTAPSSATPSPTSATRNRQPDKPPNDIYVLEPGRRRHPHHRQRRPSSSRSTTASSSATISSRK